MKYTKKQIEESIAHWQKVLESFDFEGDDKMTNGEFKSGCKDALVKIQDAFSALAALQSSYPAVDQDDRFLDDLESLLDNQRRVEQMLAYCNK